MKTLMLLLGVVLFFSAHVAAELEVQTSWYLGPGDLGPVFHWGERYYDSDSVAYTIRGQVSLIASNVNHNSWTKHIIESNGNIESHGNPIPADMDGDGDLDLVAPIGGAEDSLVWYERTGGAFVRHSVGSFVNGPRATTWPCDMDQDGDTDVVASGDEGLAWFENQGLSFAKHTIDATNRYLYARPGDMDNDGDTDIVTHDRSHGVIWGDMFLFTNDGSMGFSKSLIYNATWKEVWRINLADFDDDSFLDIQTSMDPVYVFLNDGAGSFTKSYTYASSRVDGSWPSDFDADGDMDIMCATFGGGVPPAPLFWLENDGTGTGFSYHFIGGNSGDYGDGGMASDVNLDGLMDAVGTYRYVGWFEQIPGGTFVEHRLPNSFFYDSHWVYAENLDGGPCSDDVDIDIVAARDGEYAWWENEMVTFAADGWLESSVLDPGVPASWGRFGWQDQVPDGNELRYRVRSGNTVPDLLTAPWSSPIASSGDSLSDYGISSEQYLQYRIELERTTGVADRSPTVCEVWVEWDSIPQAYKVTGGGWISGEPPGPGGKRTFGFNAHSAAGRTWGQVQFNDHSTKMKVHGTSVDTLAVHGDTLANFAGECRVDGVPGYDFYCEVEDRGEPGRGADRFSIEIYDSTGSPCYSAGDILAGGNVQIHKSGAGSNAGYGTGQGMQVRLHQNWPNPFRSSTLIRYELRSPAQATLNVYDVTGNLVRTLARGTRAAGFYAVEWDGKDNSAARVRTGVYVYKLTAGKASQSGKMIFLR